MTFLFGGRPELPPEPKGWTWRTGPDPDPLHVEDMPPDYGLSWVEGYAAGRASTRAWIGYLLASFVTGLLLGAAVARVVGL